MHSSDPFRSIPQDISAGPRMRPMRSVALPDEDRRQLRRHLRQVDASGRTFLGHVLRHKVESSAPDEDETPRDVVTGASCVTYAIDDGPAQTGLLNHRARPGAASGVIPVCSLLGAALIGMRKGQSAPLLCEDGAIVTLTVLDVDQPT
ncbi:hypothetical protein D6850_07765 [Roseovarius spongiae]|uniref:Nucleoside-diphosphate kinase n=1 Tax=Roseovarius spongiae TaxID=2320272 RepID=A0A3A8AUQ8_9RHOB|nr:hypothetical protein [Roseovarius spongiae]RKF14767.1 hypothetical protein D6850_07765 [Roseovarius spongiae]